ncbi:MAG: hypothetical protein HY698_03595 [Deltaproteobacteria bacterium]|nr:hypothetical protein [Deltaproteobacteria bacterium]
MKKVPTGWPKALLFLTMACGGEDVSVSNTSPTGSVGGVVVHAATRAPMTGVEVSLLAGGKVFPAVKTLATGTFSFRGVPYGNALVTVAGPSGFLGAVLGAKMSGQAGDFPTSNEAVTLGPIGLVPASRMFTLRILDDRGVPVGGYTITAQTTVGWVDFSSGAPKAVGEALFSATTGADGRVTLVGIPDYHALGTTINDALVVTLPPWDANEDGVLEFPGGTATFNMRSLAVPVPEVLLKPNYEPALSVVASNVAALERSPSANSLPGTIAVGEPLYIKFNLPIQSTAAVSVTDEQGAPLPEPPSSSVQGDLLKIVLATSPGNEYNLSIHAVAAVGDRIVWGDFAAAFFTRGPEKITAKATKDSATGMVRLTFSEPIGTGSHDSNNLAGENCVMFFNADLDKSGIPIGNAPGELGHASCESGRSLRSVEPDPPGPVGRSGYSSIWEFLPPTPGNAALPSATPVHLLFSRIASPSFAPRRTDGRPVPDFTGLDAILLP